MLRKCNFLAQAEKDSLKTIPQTKLFDLTESNSQMSRKVGGDVKINYFKMENQSLLSKDAIILSQGTEINLSELIEKGSQNDFSNQKPTSITTPCPSTLFHPKCSKIRNNFETDIRNAKSNVRKRKVLKQNTSSLPILQTFLKIRTIAKHGMWQLTKIGQTGMLEYSGNNPRPPEVEYSGNRQVSAVAETKGPDIARFHSCAFAMTKGPDIARIYSCAI